MNRIPRTTEQLLAWHTNAMKGVCGDDLPIHSDEPQVGWFKCRLVKQGPFVPVKVWMYQPTDAETGELVADEILQCEIDGRRADAEQRWSWFCHAPITEAEFRFMTADVDWTKDHAPHEPKANPFEKVDWSKVPTPQF